jgi:uncharacterized protein (DUF433 family)
MGGNRKGQPMGEVVSVIRAFSADHAVRLTGLSMRQLRYWDDTGFFRPRYASEDRRSPYGRVYSFRDIVGLRVLSVLRKRHKVPLQHLRKTAEELAHLREGLWSGTTLYVLDREVYLQDPNSGAVRKAIGGQYVFDVLPLRRIIADVRTKSERLRQRTAEQVGQVARHRYIAHNAWVIAGTRIPTGTIRRYIEAGYLVTDVIREYPPLTEADVLAALVHEAELADKRKNAKSA